MNKPKKQKTIVPSTPSDHEHIPISSTGLCKAPVKSKRCKDKKKRKLFSPSKDEHIVNEIQELIPGVLKKLKNENLKVDFCNLIKLISEDKFPLQNIALQLLLDVARWYSVDNTSKMFYSENCMKFWKVMFRLFHGKALRFMSGIKSSGQCLSNITTKVVFDPQDTSVNFAVPSINALNKFDMKKADIPAELSPGIIH